MVEELDQHSGFILVQGSIALIGPGAPYAITPRPTYNLIDLKEAEEGHSLEKTVWTLSNHTGKSTSFEVYVLPSVKK